MDCTHCWSHFLKKNICTAAHGTSHSILCKCSTSKSIKTAVLKCMWSVLTFLLNFSIFCYLSLHMYICSSHQPSDNYTIFFVLFGSWLWWWSLGCLELSDYSHQLVEGLVNIGAALGGTLNIRNLKLSSNSMSLFNVCLWMT